MKYSTQILVVDQWITLASAWEVSMREAVTKRDEAYQRGERTRIMWIPPYEESTRPHVLLEVLQ